MKKNLILFSALLLLLVFSCEEEIDTGYVEQPVVEAYLATGELMSVRISRLRPASEDTIFWQVDLDQLEVFIEDGERSYRLSAQGEGVYGHDTLRVQAGRKYSLSFDFGGRQVSAATMVPNKPVGFTQSTTTLTLQGFNGGFGGGFPSFPEPVELNWENPEGTYYLVLVENMETDPEPVNNLGGSEQPAFNFRSQPTTSNTTLLRAQQFPYYGRHRIILYHLTTDYAALYNNNGTNSINLTEPITNVENGYGIFTAVNSDTLFLDVRRP